MEFKAKICGVQCWCGEELPFEIVAVRLDGADDGVVLKVNNCPSCLQQALEDQDEEHYNSRFRTGEVNREDKGA